jgi:thiol-disulfide isomerase/thioredoxin
MGKDKAAKEGAFLRFGSRLEREFLRWRQQRDRPENPGAKWHAGLVNLYTRVLMVATILAFLPQTSCFEGASSSQRRASAGRSDKLIGQPPRFVRAGEGELGSAVNKIRDAEKGKAQVLIYVGATWCEPCQRFHHAVEAGELDQILPDVVFAEFDADVDEARVVAAGCKGKLIPLFSWPDQQGRCTEQRIEGGIKGDGAVENIRERLVPLIKAGIGR